MGKQAGLAPGTHSGLWSYMAAAIDALQPEFVVIENVRGLLSAPVVRNLPEGATDVRSIPAAATPPTMRVQPFARWNPTSGVWETMQPDLSGRLVPWRETWPTCGAMRDGSSYRHQSSALRTTASVSSSSPTVLFRTPLASDSSRGGESLEQVRARRGTIALSHRIIDLALNGPDGSPEAERRVGDSVVPGRGYFHRWGRYAPAIARWERVTGRPAPTPALLSEAKGPRPAPSFAEWLMGLPDGWVTDDRYGLTDNQQLTALGNGVLPLQAAVALGGLALAAGT